MLKKLTSSALSLTLVLITHLLSAQAPATKYKILMDINHGQRFWNDPANMQGKDPGMIERVNYMTGEIKKSAASVGAEVGYQKEKIRAVDLAKADLLFIHIPSSKYSADEVGAIREFLQQGGALFLVMDANYWSTLEQTNVNDIISPFGITFGNDSPDTLSGGYTRAGLITPERVKVTCHGARTVTGGTPFCFSNQSEKNPFGTFMELPKGGKLIVMGDGMVSLYMTSWKGVEDYQCSEFMHHAFKWLLK